MAQLLLKLFRLLTVCIGCGAIVYKSGAVGFGRGLFVFGIALCYDYVALFVHELEGDKELGVITGIMGLLAAGFCIAAAIHGIAIPLEFLNVEFATDCLKISSNSQIFPKFGYSIKYEYLFSFIWFALGELIIESYRYSLTRRQSVSTRGASA